MVFWCETIITWFDVEIGFDHGQLVFDRLLFGRYLS